MVRMWGGEASRGTWYRIHSDSGEVLTEATFESRCQPANERRLHLAGGERAADRIPDRPLCRCDAADILGKQVELDPGRSAVLAQIAVIAAGQRTIIVCDRHCSNHSGIDVVRKHRLKLKVKEWPFDYARRVDGGNHSIDQCHHIAAVFHACNREHARGPGVC
jgi:hypothetical protein